MGECIGNGQSGAQDRQVGAFCAGMQLVCMQQVKHLPADDWDEDYPHERTLIRTAVSPDPKFVKWINPDIRKGQPRDISLSVGEGGGIWALDRQTGQFLWASPFPFDHPNFLISNVDGKTGNGVLEAACAAGIYGIGVDVDQWLSLSADTTPTYNCIVTSAEKHLSSSVEQTIQAIAGGSAAGGVQHFNASNDGIGSSPEHDNKSLITSDIQSKLDAALAAMKAGTLTTCPATCGQP